ncbi:type II toxin-antitoxin system RelE/ParE family toxin [Planctomyces sp. SH-PL14]|uniref:type II toxin-antitoxin system RelE/ParE family toxin n=1 Tax=Planctomyces sp. SH-PL14 TaxID=1632864 RepID=UPI00078B6AA2|nr:Plasmid stabilization system protein [Planctomyces sp. SH-PL14]
MTPTARRDLRQQAQWLHARSATGAARWLNEFERTLETLAANPLSAGLAPESDFVGREIREAAFKTPRGNPYRIVFDIAGPVVRILRIRGPGQDDLSLEDLE